MIDWLTMKIPYPHTPFEQELLLKIDQQGEVKTSYSLGASVEGSYSSQVRVRSSGSLDSNTAEFLHLSGNPSKFLQGHNVIGSDDLISLAFDMFQAVTNHLQLKPSGEVVRAVRAGEYQVSLIDINYMFDVGSNQSVEAWIKSAELNTRSRNGRPVLTAGTIYWNKHSRRWAVKAYNKLTEITKGKSRIHNDFLSTPLVDFAAGKLRIELRLLRMELEKIGLLKAKDLAKKIPQLFNEYISRLIMPDSYRIPEPIEAELPGTSRLIYQSWLDGHDVSQILTRATFYRHRKILLKHGIDISLIHKRTECNVIPLIRPLEAKPVPIPQWAFELGLVHKSASNF